MKILTSAFAAILLTLLTGVATAWGPWQGGSAMSAAFYIEQRQWLSLPLDANMSQMKLTSQEGVINIFIPRKP